MREYGSEFYVSENKKEFIRSFSTFPTVRLLNTGRAALGLAAECISSKGEIIFLPAYCCESMIQPFIKRGWKVFYYSINENFSVNESELFALCEQHSPKAILLMNFFGMAPVDLIASRIKSISEELNIIEDFTHVLFSANTLSNKFIDFFAASIRKWLGIYDGAVLLAKKYYEQYKMASDAEFIKLRIDGQLSKLKYNNTKDIHLKEYYLDILRKAESYLNNSDEIYAISKSSYEILRHLNVENIGFSRKSNFNHLYDIIKDLDGVEFPAKVEGCSLNIPFSLPILVENRDLIQKQFAARGLYAQVLWPISDKGREICVFSAKMSDKMLSIPIDQRYDYDDIEDIGAIIRSVIKEFN